MSNVGPPFVECRQRYCTLPTLVWTGATGGLLRADCAWKRVTSRLVTHAWHCFSPSISEARSALTQASVFIRGCWVKSDHTAST
jgi:hypothetical protein